jgi:hypothetical protein
MAGPNSNGRGGERELLALLVQAVQAAGLPVDPPWITNLYIALKSRPMAVFVGPPGNGKRALVGCLAEVLTQRESSQFVPLAGHPWWSGTCHNPGLFIEAQTRLNAERILALVEEAWLPRNLARLFIAYLPQISPAELSGFFAELGYQLQHGELIRLPGAHLAHPVPYPRNLLVIGTLDRCWLDWCDEQVHGMTSLIPCEWPVGPSNPTPWGTSEPGAPPGSTLFRSWVRSDEAACRMLFQRPAGDYQMSSLVRRLDGRLRNRGLELPERVPQSAAIYLANAWSEDGEGLFVSQFQANLAIAMDMALVQVVLPPLARALRASLSLRCAILRDLEGFPRARALVERMGDGISRMARRPVQSGWEG